MRGVPARLLLRGRRKFFREFTAVRREPIRHTRTADQNDQNSTNESLEPAIGEKGVPIG
jgi:hypothetical protein